MHWAERTAANLSHRGDTHLIAAGITPSGEFHIGHIREILTCDMIVRACNNSGPQCLQTIPISYFGGTIGFKNWSCLTMCPHLRMKLRVLL